MWLTVITGRDAGRTVEIAGERFVVGRRRDCHLTLRDPAVAPLHAAFRRDRDRWLLEDLSTEAGTFVATKRITRPVPLRGDEELCFGETFAVLSRVDPRRPKRTPVPRRRAATIAAVGVAVAVVGATAGILAPRVGDDEQPGTLALSVPVAAPVTSSSGEETKPPRTETVPPVPSADATTPETGAQTTQGTRVLYRDRFGDPTSGWEQFAETAASAGYRDGRYVIRIDDSDFFATADSGRPFTGPNVTVTVLNVSRSGRAGVGLICGYRDQRNFTALAIGTDGTTAILREQDGVLSVLTGDGKWQASAGVPVAAPRYRLRAVCGAERLALYVNGRRVVSAATGVGEGTVGLFAAGHVELGFDDFVVRG